MFVIIVDELEVNFEIIFVVNVKDIEFGCDVGLSDVLFDWLLFNEFCFKVIVSDVCNVIGFNDFVGSEIDSKVFENGMLLLCCCVLFGVVGVIYEVCFNVIIDIVVLCLKIGNVSILCGGKEIFFFNMELVKVI